MFKFHRFYVLLLAAGFVLGGLNGCGKDDGGGGYTFVTGGETMKIEGTLFKGEFGGDATQATQVCASFDNDYYFWKNEDWAVTASVSNKKFSLTLPKPDAKYMETFSDELEVTEGYTITGDKNTKCARAKFCALIDGEYLPIALFNETETSGDCYVSFIYMDKNLSITGNFEDEGYKTTVNVQLKKGWNYMIESETIGRNGKWTYSVTANGNIPSVCKWQ